MDAKKQLWYNISQQYENKSLLEVIKNNKLTLLLKQELDNCENVSQKSKQYISIMSSINLIKAKLNLKETVHIDKMLRANNIIPFHFKGNILNYFLYDKKNLRLTGDIDIYVNENAFERAKNIIYNDGYTLSIHYGEKNPHHIVFCKNDIILELHKHILNPVLKIDETFILNNLMNLSIDNYTFCTFNYTSTMLHLLYHYYMDMFLSTNWVDPNIIFCYQDLKSVKNELLKQYEIASYAEKYFQQISWNEIFNDLHKQKLKIYFKDMINNIRNSYPKNVINKLSDKFNEINYYVESDSPLKDFYKYKALHEYKSNTEAVRNYIKECFCGNILSASDSESYHIIRESDTNKSNGKNTYVIYGNAPKSDEDLSCKFKIYNNYNNNAIKLEIYVYDDIIVFPNETPEKSLFKSDCITLYLVNCENDYIYKKLFFVPTKKGNNIEVFVFDEYNHIEIKSGIKASASITSNGYYLDISINYDFIHTSSNLSNIYFDIFVNDCDSEKVGRKTTLNFSGDNQCWFDVAHFATLK